MYVQNNEHEVVCLCLNVVVKFDSNNCMALKIVFLTQGETRALIGVQGGGGA